MKYYAVVVKLASDSALEVQVRIQTNFVLSEVEAYMVESDTRLKQQAQDVGLLKQVERLDRNYSNVFRDVPNNVNDRIVKHRISLELNSRKINLYYAGRHRLS